MVYADGMASLTQEKQFIEYELSTSEGQSGSPILVSREGKFYAVGIHLGETPSKNNFGIALN